MIATHQDGCARRRGIALLAAVFLTAAISALALSAARENRTTAQVAGNEAAAARAMRAAEAGLERMALALAREARGAEAPLGREERPHTGDGAPLPNAAPVGRDGRPYRWRFGEAEVILTAQSETGKFDLIAGDAAQLPPLLTALGAPELGVDPQAAASVILAARRRDGLGPSWRLGWRPLGDMSELERLDELPATLRARLAAVATSWARRKSSDPLTAPDAVYRTLPMTDEEREAWDAARAGPPPEWRPQAPEVVTLTAVARFPGGATAQAAALVEISPSPRDPAIKVIAKPRPTFSAALGPARD